MDIKFNAWTGKKIIKDIHKHSDFNFHCMGNYRGYVLMQFTGLQDKNGVDIYEGDIVECTMGFRGSSLPHMGEIVYMEEFGAFATENQAGKTLLQNHHLNSFTVVGNIRESPELLGE
jgi:uncharacterized phage protein (TIGR01671 family)